MLSLVTGFAQITNAVAGTRKLQGVLTLETADKTNGWVFDYEESKKYFQEWFSEIYNATEGKSYGNVRFMHQLVIGGKICEEPVFDDEKKVINCVVEVTSDEAWKAVENGTVCGLSFSGVKVPPSQSTIVKWSKLPDGQKRYIGRPLEVSLVDNPNQGGAYFKVISNSFKFENVDGSIEERKFKIQNTSFYSVSSLAEQLGTLQYQYVGDEDLQKEFDKHVNGLIGVLAKMGKNLKEEHKENTTDILTENVAKGDITMADETVTPIVVPNTTDFTAIVNTAVGGLKTDLLAAFKPMIDEAVKTQIATLGIETIKNSVDALTTKLEKTPADTTVVTTTTETERVFNTAGLSKEDADAATLINKVITVKKA
jgi:hypothetical protein